MTRGATGQQGGGPLRATVSLTPERRLDALLLAATPGANIPARLLLIYRDEVDMSDASITTRLLAALADVAAVLMPQQSRARM